MNYNEMLNNAIQKDEIPYLLCGKQPYEVIVSEFTSEILPTDINAVLVNCFYKRIDNVENIGSILGEALRRLIDSSPMELYVAILYFDTCIFHEDNGTATFEVDRYDLSNRIKNAVDKYKDELCDKVVFYNGLSKKNPMNNINQFNKYYEKNYGISIV